MRHRSIEVSIFFTLILLWFCGFSIVQADTLSVLEQKGKQIYFAGVGSSASTIVVKVGRDATPLPGSAMPCVKCHGFDGMGRHASGTVPPAVIWSHLSAQAGHRHASGRSHGPFDEAALARAIEKGIDPDGNALDISMPRYKLTNDDLAALIAYLKRLETDIEPGLLNGHIHLATLLPLEGPYAMLGVTMRATLQAYLRETNDKGGLFGRTLELDVIPYGVSPRQALENIQQAMADKSYFALISPFAVGMESQLASLMEQASTPLIGPFTLTPHPNQSSDRQTFYLLPGLQQQVRVLLNMAADRLEDDQTPVAVVGPAGDMLKRLVTAATEQAVIRGWGRMRSLEYGQGQFDAQRISQAIQEMNAQALFFFGEQDELESLLHALAPAGQHPLVFLVSSLLSRPLFDVPSVFNRRVFIAYPILPNDMTDAGRKRYSRFRQQYRLPQDHQSAQLVVYAAAQILVEGLRRAGPRLTRGDFIAAMESLKDFETGVSAPITYHRNRRIGALGAHIVAVDLHAMRYIPVAGWIDL